MGTSGRLGLAGFSATAVTFGLARNAYGLFLPDIRAVHERTALGMELGRLPGEALDRL